MAKGDRECIGCVGAFKLDARQEPLDHRLDLMLVGMPGTNDGFLDGRARVLGHLDPEPRGREQRDAAGQAELERG